MPTVEIPVCPLGYKSIPKRLSGEIHCIVSYGDRERYEYIKDILPLINRWVNSIYCACNKLGNQFVEAKLYAYREANSLFKKWDIKEFYPLFNPVMLTTDDIELVFKFENIIGEPHNSVN